jgi:hypothetical protein
MYSRRDTSLFQFFHHDVMAAGNRKDYGGFFYGHGSNFIAILDLVFLARKS